jgi:hypothetical protein
MGEKENEVKDTMESILEIFLRSKHNDRGNTRSVHESIEVRAPPEEGVRLMRAFIRIKQPELRAAIIKLVTHMADD